MSPTRSSTHDALVKVLMENRKNMGNKECKTPPGDEGLKTFFRNHSPLKNDTSILGRLGTVFLHSDVTKVELFHTVREIVIVTENVIFRIAWTNIAIYLLTRQPELRNSLPTLTQTAG